MPSWKSTIFLGESKGSASESYFNRTAASAAIADANLIALAVLRWNTMGWFASVEGLRNSDHTTSPRFVSHIVQDPLTGLPYRIDGTPPPATAVSDIQNNYAANLQDCLALNLTLNSGRIKRVYMSMVPRSIILISKDPTLRAQNPFNALWSTWKSAFNAWASELQGGKWALQVRDYTGAGALQPVVNVTTRPGPPVQVGFVVSNGGPTYNIGDKVQVSKFKASSCDCGTVPNGFWIVADIDTTSQPGKTIYYVFCSSAFDPNICQVGVINRVQFMLDQITGVAIDKVGSHNRGSKLFQAVRGHARRRKACAVC